VREGTRPNKLRINQRARDCSTPAPCVPSSRLGRLMCGKALPFRISLLIPLRLRLQEWRGAASKELKSARSESQRLSAHQAAKPLGPNLPSHTVGLLT
jgi:hypothetical protein